MVTTYRLHLDEAAFRRLVAGTTVMIQVQDMNVELVLNIAWNRLVTALADTVAERLPELARPPDPPQAREFVTTRNRRK